MSQSQSRAGSVRTWTGWGRWVLLCGIAALAWPGLPMGEEGQRALAGPVQAKATPELRRVLATGERVEALVALEAPSGTSPRDLPRWRDAVARAQERVLSCLPGLRPHLLERYSVVPMLFIRLSGDELPDLLECPGVVAVSENRRNRASLAQSVPLVSADVVHQEPGLDGFGSAVAILDTGVDSSLSELGGCFGPGCKVVGGYDFGSGDGNPTDCDTNYHHGSNVAAIAAGTRGVAPGADIVALKVFSGNCLEAADSAITGALNWVVENRERYRIVAANLSLGYYGTGYASSCDRLVPASFTPAIDAAHEAGVLVVVAAGNDGFADEVTYPSCLENAVSVANVYDAFLPGTLCWGGSSCPSPDNICADDQIRADKIVCSSNGGALIDLAAPGALIDAAGVNIGGTSQAAPHVAGGAAILAQANALVSVPQLWAYLATSSDRIEDERSSGGGGPYEYPRLNMVEALAALETDIGIDLDPDKDGYDATVDCDSSNAATHPDAAETCDGLDNNCEGQTDEGFDHDGDGFYPEPCPEARDCDDSNAEINPRAEEVKDGVDNDCDGDIDDGVGGGGCSCGAADDEPDFGFILPLSLVSLVGFGRRRAFRSSRR